jgi:hypothetical protein
MLSVSPHRTRRVPCHRYRYHPPPSLYRLLVYHGHEIQACLGQGIPSYFYYFLKFIFIYLIYIFYI